MNATELIDRLSKREVVDALAVIGSGADGTMNEVSDYDLLIVLNEPPQRLTGGVTNIEGRMVDIVFAATSDIDNLLDAKDEEVAIDGIPGSIVRCMKSARIEIDRRGRLKRLKQKAESGFRLSPQEEGEVRSRLDKASYNLAHTLRMLGSSDPDYLEAIDLRLLYQLSDLMVDYFAVRGLPYQGEKAAIRHWKAHDEEYYRLFKKCLEERDRNHRVEFYGRLAEATMEPVGPLWQFGHTGFGISPESKMTSKHLAMASEFWASLISVDEPSGDQHG